MRTQPAGPGRLLGVVLGLAAACAPGNEHAEFPRNQCVHDADCWSDTTCNTEVGVCAVKAVEQPYTVVLQISPNPDNTAGRFTWSPMQLDTVPSNPVDIVVPPFVEVQGLLSCRGAPMMAEVVFYPRATSGYPIAPVVARSTGGEGAGATNLVTRLPPNTEFDVTIQPLGPDSAACPPQRTTFGVGTTGTRFDPPAPDLVSFQGQLVEDRPTPGSPTGRNVKVRVRSKSLKRVVSATVSAQVGDSKEFTVNLLSIKQEDGVLQVDLDPEHPWSQVIEYPLPTLGKKSNNVRVPPVPQPVTLQGAVEWAPMQRIPFTELLFTSYFPLPSVSGNELDWCQLRRLSNDPSQVSCFAERRASTDAAGTFEVALLPGRYEVLVLPGSKDTSGKRVNAAVARQLQVVQALDTQQGNRLQGPIDLALRNAAELRGTFENRDGEPLPNVNVETLALSISRNPNGINSFNRTTSALTDAEGEFSLALDSGFYDVVAQPPKDSGYPWLFFPNREFDIDLNQQYRTIAALPPPVVMSGTIRGGAAGKPLLNATVDAYAIVRDLRGFVRPALIGSTQTDAEGKYMLLLPPKVEASDAP